GLLDGLGQGRGALRRLRPLFLVNKGGVLFRRDCLRSSRNGCRLRRLRNSHPNRQRHPAELCRSLNPTWINSDVVGRIGEPCRLLQRAEGKMTHHNDGQNGEPGDKKCADARVSELSWRLLSEVGFERSLVVQSDQCLLSRLWGRAFRLNVRPWFGRIVLRSRASFEPCMFINRQRSVKNIALDNSGCLQLDAESMDTAVDATTHGQLLRKNITPNSRTIGDKGI